MAVNSSVASVKLTARQSLLHQLFGDHHGWLFDRLRARLGCPSDAADMASETFAHVVALDDPHSIREPRALLTTIAKRLVYASWRRRDLERAYLETLAGEPEQFAPSAEQQALAVEALVEIDRMLEGLSSRARAAFLYSQLDGMTYLEIGRELGVSVPRVHQYVVQGLRACFGARL
ncbi:sigma-70 family RNA polymerase sigma factor [Pseudomonas sp. CFBP 8772]|uniref:sigma-70 family RNA polymerase sigma factor n=1 Tax=Pseudomonas sp. CFBP 8772 TaxID=2775284 RepID=UPI0017868826|nr:sigma-70 family RNA polymerase sigma factor [Pseudomonas sp. CFBP 8772]MBD8599013.1 sigma-70 family RNA polymerase sigma factor [Pseudomonas sp. CFBP 8772]